MSGTYTNLLFHIVFSTKNRLPLITPEIEIELYPYIAGICRNKGAKLIIANGMSDHVHLLVQLKPSILLSDFVRDVKANTSKWINEEKSKHKTFRWQDGYAAFTVSKSQVEKVFEYIRTQKEHHGTVDHLAELKMMLTKHEISFEDKYVEDG